MFGKIFGKKKLSEEEEEKLEDEWYDKKSQLMESILGKEHDMVMHALIPFEIGGALDLYYYPNIQAGTGIATKELSYACRESSTNDKYKKYELVMFTRETLNLDIANDENTPFGKAHQNISFYLVKITNDCNRCISDRLYLISLSIGVLYIQQLTTHVPTDIIPKDHRCYRGGYGMDCGMEQRPSDMSA